METLEITIPLQWTGEKIRAARIERGWSQQELAEELGCRLQTISEWESGKYVPQNAYQRILTVAFK